ncbi:carboxymuconolactone decarboxylase family protein [Nocardia canadensis]|uniref:carboxymuconolactone decarboxylase family protein n=1 Tax=Nocardia canadensis TaxID=3065238 RepID=UPI0029309FD6|nr:carboxymuconolactone decarboxylase family protein [Nocardia canadensis]
MAQRRNSFDQDPSEAFVAGLTIRKEVMGERFVDQALGRADGTESGELQRFVTENVWGAVWTRPGLDRRSRSLLTIGILTALRAHEELAGHVRGALANGLTHEEITEAIVHCAGYCGAPAALSAMRVVQKALGADTE